MHDGAHPLSPGPRLAGAAAAKHQPDGPWRAAAGVLWRQLIVARPKREIVMQAVELVRAQAAKERLKRPQPD